MKILSSFNLISHPDRTLERHLEGCNEVSKAALSFKYINDKTFFSKEDLEKWRELLVYFHDFGKGTDFFLYKIINAISGILAEKNDDKNNEIITFFKENEEFIISFKKDKSFDIQEKIRLNDKLGNHAKLGAYMLFGSYENDNKIINCILLKVIRKHHGHLTNFLIDKNKNSQIRLAEADIEEVEMQLKHFNNSLYLKILDKKSILFDFEKWKEIKAKFSSIRGLNEIEAQLKKEKTVKYFFLQHFLFSLLLAADKGDMMLDIDTEKIKLIKPKKLFPIDLVDFYKANILKYTKKEIDIKREQAYQDIIKNTGKFSHKNFFSITLPTGLGKTFCAYKAAMLLQNQYFKETNATSRIVYCLPFTSIIDQNAQILGDILKSYPNSESEKMDTLMVMHHHLAYLNEKYDSQELINDESEYLTETWEHEFVITTFVQFLESIFTDRNRNIRKFHNMANAIFILDEVQSIPPKYYGAIEVVFKKMAEYFNTKFIFVTATQPFIFKNNDDIIELSDPSLLKTRLYFEQMNRIELDQSLLKNNNYQPQELQDIFHIFKNDIENNPTKSFLFIFNTIAYSQDAFTFLRQEFPDHSIIYLSAGVLSKRRKQLINLIKRNIKNNKTQLIVSTQVIEAGVDIDLDVVYRDFAPIDSINQSCGRCNRNGINGKGIVKLFHTGKSSKIYDSILLNKTEEVLKEYPIIIEEANLYEINLQYAEKIRQSITSKSDVSPAMIKNMECLQLEDLADAFELIEDKYPSYNVFIPYNGEAKRVWKKYVSSFKIEDNFKRKRYLKTIKPVLLQYITKFPKGTEEYRTSKETYIINEPCWENYYSLITGFIKKRLK